MKKVRFELVKNSYKLDEGREIKEKFIHIYPINNTANIFFKILHLSKINNTRQKDFNSISKEVYNVLGEFYNVKGKASTFVSYLHSENENCKLLLITYLDTEEVSLGAHVVYDKKPAFLSQSIKVGEGVLI